MSRPSSRNTGACSHRSVKSAPDTIDPHQEANAAMFSHVMIGTNDLERAKSFYDALLGTLGVRPGRVDGQRIFWMTKTGTFSVSKPLDGNAAVPANGGTIGFLASSPEQADAWHATGIANGATSCE